jgi:subtilase family serine protease
MRSLAVAFVVLLSLVVAASSLPNVVGISGTSSVPPFSFDESTHTAIVTDAVPLPSGSPTHALSASRTVALSFVLANPHAAPLDAFLAQVEDPSSALYRHFLSSEQYLSEFAPPVSSATQVTAALRAAGGSDVTTTSGRVAVNALMSVGSAEALLGVRFVAYGSVDDLPLYTTVGSLSLPSGWSALVSGVDGLSNANSATSVLASTLHALPTQWSRTHLADFVQNTSTGEDWFLGSDYTQAYGATRLFPGAGSVPNATYPTSVAIATLLGSAYNASAGGDLPPWDPAVIATYFNGTLGPGWPMPNFTGVPVTLANVTPSAPGSFHGANDTLGFEMENSLDLEMAGSLAPGASVYNFYFAGSLLTGAGPLGDVASYFASELGNALNYSYLPRHLAVVSCSFGMPDLYDAQWNGTMEVASAMGVTVVVSSGDQGDAPDSDSGLSIGQWPGWPATAATDLWGSVSVGGVSLSMSGTPSSSYNGGPLNLSYDASAGSISGLSAWYDTLGGAGTYVGTEGGISTEYAEPLWQFDSAAEPAIVNATLEQGASSLGRAGPDVALSGNDTLASVFANASGTVFLELLEGTSIAAPVLAGLLADVVAVENRSLGFIDPEIYRFASYFATHSTATSDPFLDVTQGGNWVFSASAGWDATTGWGGVNAPAFLTADENTTLLRYVYTGPSPGLPPLPSSSGSGPVPWTLIFIVFGVGIAVAIALVAVAARPSRNRAPPAGGVPWGAQMGGPTWSPQAAPPGGYPGATFQCPYCGALRPAEPVRCPECGAF